MILLPFEKIELITNLGKEEVYKRLSSIIVSYGRSDEESDGYIVNKYRGKLSYDSFKIMRVIKHKNSFRPVITGQIIEKGDTISVKAKLRPHYVVLIAIIVFFIIFSVIQIAFFCGDIQGNEKYIPLGMMLFLYIMILFGFHAESDNSIEDLEILFGDD